MNEEEEIVVLTKFSGLSGARYGKHFGLNLIHSLDCQQKWLIPPMQKEFGIDMIEIFLPDLNIDDVTIGVWLKKADNADLAGTCGQTETGDIAEAFAHALVKLIEGRVR